MLTYHEKTGETIITLFNKTTWEINKESHIYKQAIQFYHGQLTNRLVLPFWYRPTRVVLDKGPLNKCSVVCVTYQDARKTACICTHIRRTGIRVYLAGHIALLGFQNLWQPANKSKHMTGLNHCVNTVFNEQLLNHEIRCTNWKQNSPNARIL